jgi:hypothetical protein
MLTYECASEKVVVIAVISCKNVYTQFILWNQPSVPGHTGELPHSTTGK